MGSKSSAVVRTLMGSRFQLVSGIRKPSYMLLEMNRYDEFGHKSPYMFAHCDRKLSEAEILGLKSIAGAKGIPLVVIGEVDGNNHNVICLSESKLFGKLGGTIQSFLPLESEYGEHLIKLGRNSLPNGFQGEADDLFEIYAQQGLEFLLQERVVRYGQERRFEVVPDGLIASNSFVFLYDCKAAKDGYAFGRDSIRQFSDYIKSFHERYSAYAPRIHSFLVVSGYFKSPETLVERSQELYAECQVPLACLTSDEMRVIVELFTAQPMFRRSVDWKKILSSVIINAADVRKNLQDRKKDKVIPVTEAKTDGNLS